MRTQIHKWIKPALTFLFALSLWGCNGCGQKGSTPSWGVQNPIPPAAAGQFMVLSQDGTHLINTVTNKPVFITGEDAFTLNGNLSNADLETYLSDRAAKGYNLIWIAAVDNTFSIGPPNDSQGNAPFSGGNFQGMQELYFSHLDFVIQRAAFYGITVLLNPAFSGVNCQNGWCQQIEGASDATMTAFGAYLGNRYKNSPNIIWLIGGDADIVDEGSAIKNKLNDIAVGIRSADTVHLMTAENIRGESSLDEWSGASWLNLNGLYNLPQDFATAANSNYQRSDFLPLFELEDWYEGEHSMTPLGLRTEAYGAVLGGGYLGQFFGNNAIWTFGDSPWDTMGQTWQSQLNSTGSLNRSYLGKLFRSREHWKMVPDINHAVVIAGYGSGSTLSVASRSNDGKTIISYIPNGNAATLTVDMTKITSAAGQAKCWWFNPGTGAATQISGTFTNAGSSNFTPPDTNDWVLVIDDAGAQLPAPGSADL